MKTFVAYVDRYDYCEEMSNDEKANLFDCIRSYTKWYDCIPLDTIKFIRNKIKKMIDEDKSKREEKSNLNRENVNKRRQWYKDKEKKNKIVYDRIPSNANAYEPIPPHYVNVNVNDNVNVNVNVNDNVNSLKENNLYIKGVEDFILFQKDNIPWINYQIEKQWEDEYLQKQYQAYNKIISTNKITPNNLDRILDFVKQDKFWNKQIGSITKLLDKNKEWVPYWVVMIDKIKTKIDDAPKVFKIAI